MERAGTPVPRRLYRTTQELASNVFRKGYQWPFHATRMLDFGSSLVDLAIYRETQAGRRVFMDFNRNPLSVPVDAPFSLESLDDDVRAYLGNAGADQPLPIDRLRHMNPLAIERYRRYKVDIAAEPLEFAVNNQHMNGGIAVDTWGRSSLPASYAVGEAAGTHGVTRPGGAALNAGQVFGTRAAEHVAASGRATAAAARPPRCRRSRYRRRPAILRPDSPLTVRSVRASIQNRMSDQRRDDLRRRGHRGGARRGAGAQRRRPRQGHRLQSPGRGGPGAAMAADGGGIRGGAGALDHYIRHGGGSRGARAILDPAGASLPATGRSARGLPLPRGT